MSRSKPGILRRREPLRIGFSPVKDCAPLVYAHEAGLFAKYDLEVELRRGTSWGDIREQVIYGELDGAHAPATLPFLSNLGLESEPCDCIAGLVLSLQGITITLSRGLWERGVRDAETLREEIYRGWGKKTYTFGVALPFTTERFLLGRWLKSGGIVPQVEVRLLALPPWQMFPTLRLGYIDGYCVGEPWGALAVQAGEGFCVATSAELAPLHPEKVLMVRQSFATGRPEEHERLLAALLEACACCDSPQNRGLISDMLADASYVNAPADCLSAGLVSPLAPGREHDESLAELTIFHRHHANEPTDQKAAWVMGLLYEFLEQSSQGRGTHTRAPVLKNVFRRDIFERAQALIPGEAKRTREEAEICESGAM